jgi:hypothetical protein
MFIRSFDNHRSRFVFTTLFALALAPSLWACTDDGTGMEAEAGTETDTETGGDMALAIVGTYMDNFGDTHMISETEWINSAGTFEIAEWNNDEMWLVAQNAETNEYSPGLWSRFDWAWDDQNQLYYCQSVFDGATMEAALAGSANAGDLMMGCGGFSWTQLDLQ